MEQAALAVLTAYQSEQKCVPNLNKNVDTTNMQNKAEDNITTLEVATPPTTSKTLEENPTVKEKQKHPRKKKLLQKLAKETGQPINAEDNSKEVATNEKRKRSRRSKKNKKHNEPTINDVLNSSAGIESNNIPTLQSILESQKTKMQSTNNCSAQMYSGMSLQEILEQQLTPNINVITDSLSNLNVTHSISRNVSITESIGNCDNGDVSLKNKNKSASKQKKNYPVDGNPFKQKDNLIPSKPGTSQQSKDQIKGVNKKSSHPSHTKSLENKDKSQGKENVKSKRNKRENIITFEDYLSLEAVTSGLYSGELFTGYIRVNPKNANESYISNEDKSVQDFLIPTLLDRNRALDGDFVVFKLKPSTEWRDGQKTAQIVYIQKEVHPRTAVGYLKEIQKNYRFAHFVPRDYRVPRMRIPMNECPKYFLKEHEKYGNQLFFAKLIQWNQLNYGMGKLLEHIGPVDDLSVETKAILVENCLDVTPFGPEYEKFLPKNDDISEIEIGRRRDLTKECIFTIDPATARDLDDAVSCKELENGNLEIGVHISDVTYYLEEGTLLDETVCKKGTTIYLVETVYHMLPVELCLHCSLLPGKDKLAFSVFWEITKEGEIVSHSFSKTILNSCVQLSYEHVQTMIDDPDKTFEPSELPQIHNGFTINDIRKTVDHLQRIAVKLRQDRYDNGALQINQPKVSFHLNKETGKPESMLVYENKASHRLIEEFMLLANITVAKRICEDFPQLAFLRSHHPPAEHMMIEMQRMMEELGIHLDISSSGNLHKSLCKYKSPDALGRARSAVLNHLCAKPMTRAHYFCANNATDPDDYRHYALSVDMYTHFTSPIRRYADVMVHRLLNASLEYSAKPNWNPDDVAEIAANCNKQKYNAKKAGEQSTELYFCHYVDANQPYYTDAVVVDVKDHSFDVILIESGTAVRIYMNYLQDLLKIKWTLEKSGSENKKVWRMHLHFPAIENVPETHAVVQIFTMITVSLKRKEKSHKLEGHPIHPTKWSKE